MIEILKWNVPTNHGKRTYTKMILKSNISDIMLSNINGDARVIGKCDIVINDVGLYADNIEYFVDRKVLQNLLDSQNIVNGTTDLTLACYAHDRTVIDDAEFAYLDHQLFVDDDIDQIVRDLKIQTVL